VKVCNRCKTKKPNKSFTVNNARPDNRDNRCRECVSEIRKNKYDPTKAKKQWKRNKYSLPIVAEERRLMAAYGITVKIRDYMLKLAGNSCEICGEKLKLVIDHDHGTGVVRGMLCSRCNRGLGHFDDNINLLSKALKYIKIKTEQNNTEFAG
jgi:hypothetical protein